jgi:Secretion system effector C (SseC) like family
MTQVQSLQSKLSTNQMSSSSHQLSTDHVKMDKAIKEYNDRIKKEHEQEHKAHSKGLIGKIVDAVEDAVEVVAGVALCLIPGAQIAGAALLATAAISITDQVVTGAFGNKPLLTGKDAEIFNYCAMGASIAIGVATCGAGLLTSGAAVAADAAGDVGEGIEMTEMAAQAGEDTATTASTAVKAGSTAMKATDIEDAVDTVEDVADTAGNEGGDEDVDESSDSDSDSASDTSPDTEQPQTTRSTQNLAREQMEEAFEEGFEEDVADSGSDSGDGSGDGDSTGVPRRDLAIAGMKIGARMVKGVFGVVQAAGGITQGVNTIEIGKAMSQAEKYEAEATDAQKDIHTATLDMKQTIGTLQNQIQQYEAINKDLTGVIMGYAQTQTDTAVQGYA